LFGLACSLFNDAFSVTQAILQRRTKGWKVNDELEKDVEGSGRGST
jgi:hypothetical protein